MSGEEMRVGRQGRQGVQGLEGIEGLEGQPGIDGPPGPEGPVGPEGPSGGEQGEQGVQGRTGNPATKAFLAVVVVTFLVTLGLAYQLHRQQDSSRSQINKLGQAACLAGRVNTTRYNDFVQSAIENRRDLIVHAKANRDMAQLAINRKAIARFHHDFLPVATLHQCNTPILK